MGNAMNALAACHRPGALFTCFRAYADRGSASVVRRRGRSPLARMAHSSAGLNLGFLRVFRTGLAGETGRNRLWGCRGNATTCKHME